MNLCLNDRSKETRSIDWTSGCQTETIQVSERLFSVLLLTKTPRREEEKKKI